MRKYDLVETTQKQQQLVRWECSICGLDFLKDDMEAQEVFTFSGVGGYTSIFGDGAEICIDICQHCFEKHLRKYATIV